MTSTGQRWRCRARSASGAAITELALLTPILCVVLLGVADFGRIMYTSIVLSHAARAGAQYGAQTNGKTGDTVGIRQAAINEAQDIGAISVASSRVCFCPTGGTVNCLTTTCSGYGVPQVAVQVTVSTTFNTVTVFPGVPSSVSLSRQALVRVQ
jgi:Flp pilus assembly protein TadG